MTNKIGIVVTGHEYYSSGLLSAMEVMVGPQDSLFSVCYKKTDTPEALETRIRSAFKDLMEDSHSIIVLTDFPFGTPMQVASMAAQEYPHVKIIGGANLPMLCEACSARAKTDKLSEVVESIMQAGRDSLIIA